MIDILDLPGWTVTDKRLDNDDYIIEAKFEDHPSSCQKCGVSGALYRHGPKCVIYRDSPIRGRSVRLKAHLQRYKCRACNETFLQPVRGIDTDRRMTTRCIQYIEDQCLHDTFVRLSEHLGCDEKTIRNIAGDYLARMNMPDMARSKQPRQEKTSTRAPQKNRCISCRGLFDAQDMQLARMEPLLQGEPKVYSALLCTHCSIRFRTRFNFIQGDAKRIVRDVLV